MAVTQLVVVGPSPCEPEPGAEGFFVAVDPSNNSRRKINSKSCNDDATTTTPLPPLLKNEKKHQKSKNKHTKKSRSKGHHHHKSSNPTPGSSTSSLTSSSSVNPFLFSIYNNDKDAAPPPGVLSLSDDSSSHSSSSHQYYCQDHARHVNIDESRNVIHYLSPSPPPLRQVVNPKDDTDGKRVSLDDTTPSCHSAKSSVDSNDSNNMKIHKSSNDKDKDRRTKKSLWYSKKEIKQMREKFNDAYQTIKKENDDSSSSTTTTRQEENLLYKQALLQLYEAACAAAALQEQQPATSMMIGGSSDTTKSTSGSRNNTSSSLLVKNKQERKQVRKVLRKQVERIGLERLCVADVAAGHKQRRQDLIKQVLSFQAAPVAGSLSPNMDEDGPCGVSVLTAAERAQVLRQACEAISLPSRLFAQQLATIVASSFGSSSNPHRDKSKKCLQREKIRRHS